jgi:hypothetical protein
MFRKRIQIFSSILLALFFFIFSFNKASALDIDNERPTPLWGLPSAEWIDPTEPDVPKKAYGEPESTIVIRNTAPELLPDMSFLADCVLNSGTTLANCFYFDDSSANAKLLNSKTYVNNKLKSAVAILRYGGVNVYGDSSSADSDFLYWGRHLRQTRDNSDSNSYWETKSYRFNPDAQAFWDIDDPNKNIVMSETIERLKKDSKSPKSILSGPFFNIRFLLPTQFDGVCGYSTNAPCLETSTHPEGALWYEDQLFESDGFVGGLVINRPLEYQNKGTFLIDKGGLSINASVKASSTDGALGFIVTDGDVVIQNHSNNAVTVRVSIFAPNSTIKVQGDRINLIGSFVAKDFIVDSTVDVANFIQDTRGETSWPPGFRELKLPQVTNQ